MKSIITASMIEDNAPIVPVSFWEDFVRLSYNKSRPVVMQQSTLVGPNFTLDEVFRLARNIVKSQDMTVNADGEMLKQPVVPEFPVDFEGFEAFVRCFAAQNNARGITFTRDYCLKYSSTVSAKLRAFADGYTKRYGVPYPGGNAVFIGGRYSSTWIGLHNDSCDTFLFPVYGRKRMMIWPPDYFKSMALEKKSALNGVCFGHIDISSYAADAIVYEVAAGEIFFIPAGWWHYNKLEELETTLTVSVGMFSHGTAKSFCENPIKASMASAAGEAQLSAMNHFPGTVFGSLAEVQLPHKVVELIESIKDNSKIQMLLKLSANGVIRNRNFDHRAPLHWPNTRVRGRPDSPLYLLALSSTEGILFAGGGMMRVDNFQSIQSLVMLLHNNTYVTLAQLRSDLPSDENVLDVVRWLYAQAVIDVTA